MESPWCSESSNQDLPDYLSEPLAAARPGLRKRLEEKARARPRDTGGPGRAPEPSVPFGGMTPRLSPTFSRMVELRRDRLPAALDAWWAVGQHAGSVRVHQRLELKPPEGEVSAGWRMEGRVRRTLHWTPVVVELWPKHDDFAMITMTPQRPVLATRRYFRVGHAVLDRLWVELAERAAPSQ